MADQIIMVSDDQGNFTGDYITRMVGHTGQGRRHLAITVLLKNSKNQLLLQKRKHQIFDKVWDFTGATHPLHNADKGDETFKQAAVRCLDEEWSIEEVELKNLGTFNYFADYGDLCENEHCAIFVGSYNGHLKLNKSDGYEYKWVDQSKFLSDIAKNPQNYSPWAIEGTKLLQIKHFFD